MTLLILSRVAVRPPMDYPAAGIATAGPRNPEAPGRPAPLVPDGRGST